MEEYVPFVPQSRQLPAVIQALRMALSGVDIGLGSKLRKSDGKHLRWFACGFMDGKSMSRIRGRPLHRVVLAGSRGIGQQKRLIFPGSSCFVKFPPEYWQQNGWQQNRFILLPDILLPKNHSVMPRRIELSEASAFDSSTPPARRFPRRCQVRWSRVVRRGCGGGRSGRWWERRRGFAVF